MVRLLMGTETGVGALHASRVTPAINVTLASWATLVGTAVCTRGWAAGRPVPPRTGV